jgi:hypothetical protein
MGLKAPALLLATVAIVSSLVVIVTAVASQSSDRYAGPLRIASVTYTPEAPGPGAEILVRAEVVGQLILPMDVNLQYATYFERTAAGGGEMVALGDRVYESRVPGFPDGTEVWFVVAVSAPGRDPVVSDSFTIDIGSVPRGSASGLRITEVSHAPAEPMPWEVLTVGATVTSLSPQREVHIAYMAFCPSRPPVGIDPEMTMVAPTRYTFTIETPGECAGMPGTVLLYRVLAVDATGNTAVSDVQVVHYRDQGLIR